MDSTRYTEQLMFAASEAAYERLAGYRLAQGYVKGKIVADIGWEEVGYGSQLLAENSSSVVGLTGSQEAVDRALAANCAPNATFEKVDILELPYPENHFDVVVALGVVENLEQPGRLVREARRVLKQDGILILSAPDKRAHTNDRRGMYVPDFRELLEQHFERAQIYRHGVLAGGVILPISGEFSEMLVESASLFGPCLEAEPPTLHSVIAVCGDAEVLGQEEQPCLLLDRDRRIFDECEDRAEDVELLRSEIQRMQETEVQAFQDSYQVHSTELAYLRAQVRRSRGAEARARRSEAQARRQLGRQVVELQNVVREMENSTTWRLFEPYRRLRTRIDAMRKRTSGTTESSDHRSV
jgi:SAM-dependent methyltransferase